MDSVGLSRLKGIEKDRLKAEEQKVTTETVTAAIKQRKRVSFTILGHNNKDNVSSSSIRRVKGFSRKCKKCNGVFMKEELRNNPNSNHEPIEQRGAKRPSNALPHTCSRGSKNKHGKCDNDIDMERKKTVPMKEPIGIMRVPPRFSSSSTSSLNNNNNNNNNNNGNIGAPQHVQHAQQQQPIVRFKYSKLLKALKRSNETRGLIEKTVKKIKTDFNSSSLISSSSPASASASASAPNNCTNNNDSEEESRRRCSVRRKGCAEFTKAMMAQTLPSTMISYVENNVMIFNSNNSNSNSNSKSNNNNNNNNNSNNNNHNSANVMMPSMMMMMNRRRRCATMGNGGRTRIVHRILIDQHKRILGDNNNERKDNTTTTKNPSTTGKKKMKEDDK